MSKVVVDMNLTLNGVLQAPGQPDEGPLSSVEYNSWAGPFVTKTFI